MPTQEHELLTQLFRDRPTLAPDLLKRALGVQIPPFAEARIGSAELNECAPTEYRADAVVELLTDDGGMAVVVEVQRNHDKDKHWSWPVYLATLRARIKRPATLLVVCPDAATALKCAAPIPMGHPEWVLTPLVVGPTEIPVVTDLDLAADQPELTTLSALAHRTNEQVLYALQHAVHSMPDRDKAVTYADFVTEQLPGPARKYLEGLMATGTYEFKTPFFRDAIAKGVAQGVAEGEAKAVLRVLEARGIAVPDDTRALIRDCEDLEQVEAWLDRAVTATTVDDLFD